MLTGVLVLLMLLANGFAAFALGKRFRIYSIATLAAVIAMGAAMAPAGSKLAASQPTPGFGILERINVYSFMLWVGVFSVALYRRRGSTLQGAFNAASSSASRS